MELYVDTLYGDENLSLADDGYRIVHGTNRSGSVAVDTAPGWSVFVMVLLMFAIISANALMCMAIHKTPTPRFVTNILTLNLGVSDLGIALFCIPMSLGVMTNPDVPRGYCNLVAFITVTLMLVSVATLATISLDRYYSICHALRYPIEMTGRRGYCVLGFIWTQSVLFAAMPLCGWGEYRVTEVAMCLPQWSVSPSYAAFMLILGLLLPFCCMLFSYSCIVQEARKQAQRICKLQLTPTCEIMSSFDDKDHLMPGGRRLSVLASRWRRPSITSTSTLQGTTTAAHNFKTLSTVFIIVGTFVACWCPYVALTAWSSTLPRDVQFAGVAMALCGCVLNPCVFVLLTRDLRHTAFHLLMRVVTCRKQSSVCGAYCSGRRASGTTINMHSRDSRPSMDSGVDIELLKQPLTKHSYTDKDNNLLAPPPSPVRCSHGHTHCHSATQLLPQQQVTRVVTPKSLTIPTIVVHGQTD
jgi:hypothetical protein